MLRAQSWPSLAPDLLSLEAAETVMATEPPSHHVRRCEGGGGGGGGRSVISVSERNGIFYSLDETDPPRSERRRLARGLSLHPLTTIQETEASTTDITFYATCFNSTVTSSLFAMKGTFRWVVGMRACQLLKQQTYIICIYFKRIT